MQKSLLHFKMSRKKLHIKFYIVTQRKRCVDNRVVKVTHAPKIRPFFRNDEMALKDPTNQHISHDINVMPEVLDPLEIIAATSGLYPNAKASGHKV